MGEWIPVRLLWQLEFTIYSTSPPTLCATACVLWVSPQAWQGFPDHPSSTIPSTSISPSTYSSTSASPPADPEPSSSSSTSSSTTWRGMSLLKRENNNKEKQYVDHRQLHPPLHRFCTFFKNARTIRAACLKSALTQFPVWVTLYWYAAVKQPKSFAKIAKDRTWACMWIGLTESKLVRYETQFPHVTSKDHLNPFLDSSAIPHPLP